MAIFGKTQSGKTYFLKKKMRSASQFLPVIICDIKHDYHGIKEIPSLDKFNWDVKNGIFRFRCWDESSFNKFCDVAWSQITMKKSRRAILIFDEIAMYVKNRALKQFPTLQKIICMGASYGIGVWVASQRPAMLDKDILANCKYIVAFHMDMHHDLEAIEDYIDPEKVKNLKPHWYLVYDDVDGVSEHAPL